MALNERDKMLLSAYFDGEVSLEEREYVERLLERSEDARAFLNRLGRLRDLTKAGRQDVLPHQVEERLRKAIESGLKEEVPVMRRNAVSRSLVRAGGLLVVLVVAVLVHGYLKRAQLGGFKTEVVDKMAGVASSQVQKRRAQVQPSSSSKGQVRLSMLSRAIKSGFVVDKGLRQSSGVVYELALGTTSTPSIVEGNFTSWRYNPNFNTEEYAHIEPNEFLSVKDNPLSTFSIDVDTASYSLVRRFIEQGQIPPAGAVRIEELINYFSYEYPLPEGDKVFSITVKGGTCPWNSKHKIVMIGLKGRILKEEERPESNLVFLIDVSGSMATGNKLPLLKRALKKMVQQLSEKERIAIVVYAGDSKIVLDSTPGNKKSVILSAIDSLYAGGSTNGGAGIKMAYQIAEENFIKGGNNRVILATDGDFNVGITSQSDLVKLIEEERKKGIFLTVLGFGMGNYKDATMEMLADKGNGNYYYIDTLKEAYKVLVKELGSTLYTIAKDVKIQVEFNPAKVKAYRLIGYENRLLNREDFNDDTKDAGELGAGHTVTALYEIVPADSDEEVRKADDLKYQKLEIVPSDEVMTVKLRYKEPDGEKSKLITRTVKEDVFTKDDRDFKFVCAVAEFGLILRRDPYRENANYDQVIDLAEEGAKGSKYEKERREFIELVKKAKEIDVDYDTEEVKGISFKE